MTSLGNPYPEIGPGASVAKVSDVMALHTFVTAHFPTWEECAHSRMVHLRIAATTGVYADACNSITHASDGMYRSLGNIADMVAQATEIARSASVLVSRMEQDAVKESSVDRRRRMEGIVKSITVTTSELVNAAASATTFPDDRATQQNLVRVGHALGGLALHARDI
eukprot:m.647592 g.647592  ORF g.647592 m.647592 type:complete len:167 (+) comp22658_c2_seq4:2625-3125(+)